MNQSSIYFKGIRGGLKIYIKEEAQLYQVKKDLLNKIKESRHFFEGSVVNLLFTGKRMNDEEKNSLIEFISNEINIGNVEFKEEQLTDLDEDVGSDKHSLFSGVFDGIEEGMTKFIRGTIRNGQRIFYEGNVVIIGDINPGGEIIAGGNIVVLGILRGMAHAGATGNTNAIVASFSLQPTQLRIAGIITRPPEDDILKPPCPEIAYIKDSTMVIEPYLPSRSK